MHCEVIPLIILKTIQRSQLRGLLYTDTGIQAMELHVIIHLMMY